MPGAWGARRKQENPEPELHLVVNCHVMNQTKFRSWARTARALNTKPSLQPWPSQSLFCSWTLENTHLSYLKRSSPLHIPWFAHSMSALYPWVTASSPVLLLQHLCTYSLGTIHLQTQHNYLQPSKILKLGQTLPARKLILRTMEDWM